MSRELVLQLQRTIEEFWAATKLTHHNFEREIHITSTQNYAFKEWEKLIGLAQGLLEFERITADMMELIYLVMALDNRNKEVLRFIVSNVSEANFEMIAKYAQHCPFPDTRWQIAEALGEKSCSFCTQYLERYLIDDEPYVISKALYSLSKINEEKAVEHSRKLLFGAEGQVRETAKYILERSGA
jgi:HEAT repeat protein